MRSILITLITLFMICGCEAQTPYEFEEKIRAKIDKEFRVNFDECNSKVDAVTDFNGKTEFWRICDLKNNNRIIKIESHKGTFYYQEIYFEKNGDLIYAKETENYMPKNSFQYSYWDCQFYAQNGELLSYISLGHGKTETEEWNPDTIFDMYKKRLNELEKIEK